MYRVVCLTVLALSWLSSTAQKSFGFTCDVYREDVKLFSNLKGKILCDIESSTGKYCLLVSVPDPQRRGRVAFGYNTDPEAPDPQIRYYAAFLYDDDLKKVYSIVSDEFELMIFVKYKNGNPFQIIMSEKGSDNTSAYITIPYSEVNYNGIYGVINYSKKKIHYRAY